MTLRSGLRRLALLTSGGDCAGLNAVLRAVVLRATKLGYEVIGIQDGTHGLMARPTVRAQILTPHDVDVVMFRQGGTILGTTNQGDPFAFRLPNGNIEDRSEQVINGLKSLECEALIGIGGDGSLAILQHLAHQGGFQFIGIPKTIDNDVGATEVAVGFSTAVDVAAEALDRLQPTAASHARIMILEVMGRDAGHIALAAGIAGGADVILIPEIPYHIDNVAAHIDSIRDQGRNFALVVVSEAVLTEGGQQVTHAYGGGDQVRLGGIGDYIGTRISALCKAETRVTVLGHVQRGGVPSATDRIMASAFGVKAVDLIAAGQSDRMVAWCNRQVVDVPLSEAIASCQLITTKDTLVATARGLGICLGDD